MLKEEYHRLMSLFHEAAEGKIPNLEEVFTQSLEFFEHLKIQIVKGSQEEKQEALQMMSEMYAQMIAESKRICERSGMTEEQLLSFAENPINFSLDQWNAIQASREKIVKAGHDLARAIEDVVKAGSIPSSYPEQKPKERKHKKSGWMRS